jgi:DNA polymerase-1
VDEDACPSVRERIVDLMSRAADLSVALKVDAGIGRNWDEAH